jgi:hypothetical protein
MGRRKGPQALLCKGPLVSRVYTEKFRSFSVRSRRLFHGAVVVSWDDLSVMHGWSKSQPRPGLTSFQGHDNLLMLRKNTDRRSSTRSMIRTRPNGTFSVASSTGARCLASTTEHSRAVTRANIDSCIAGAAIAALRLQQKLTHCSLFRFLLLNPTESSLLGIPGQRTFS